MRANSLIYRYRYGAFIAPSTSDACKDGASLHARSSGPIDKQFSLALSGYVVIIAAIAVLGGPRHPPKIARFVMTVVVDTIYGHVGRRSIADLGEKLLKTRKAELDAASAVVSIMFVLGVCAASFCARINHILRRASSAVYGGLFQSEASARFTHAAFQVLSQADRQLTALAGTMPSSLAALVLACIPKHGQSSKRVAGYVDKFWIGREWLKHNSILPQTAI